MVAGLIKHLAIADVAVAEDVVQETFLAAHQQWDKNPPMDPEAWLFKVCKNIALKTMQHEHGHSKSPLENCIDDVFADETKQGEESLWILVACAHSRFSPKQQVIFALRYAVGFKVEQISSLLGSPPETITKTLQRLRKIIKEENHQIHLAPTPVPKEVHGMLLKVIYLMFSEGYKTARGKSILNITLCEDALSLIQYMNTNKSLSSPETKALYALMLFNLSRFEARFTAVGDLIDLENQDRSKWNDEMITLATHYLNKAKTGNLSTYHLEGAIAYLHCTAKSFEAIDWQKIVSLYGQLLQFNESPFVKLNLAIAMFYAGDFKEAMLLMKALGKIAFINRYYVYHVAMGKMLSRVKDFEIATVHFQKGISLTSHIVEKKYIQNLIEQIPLAQR